MRPQRVHYVKQLIAISLSPCLTNQINAGHRASVSVFFLLLCARCDIATFIVMMMNQLWTEFFESTVGWAMKETVSFLSSIPSMAEQTSNCVESEHENLLQLTLFCISSTHQNMIAMWWCHLKNCFSFTRKNIVCAPFNGTCFYYYIHTNHYRQFCMCSSVYLFMNPLFSIHWVAEGVLRIETKICCAGFACWC